MPDIIPPQGEAAGSATRSEPARLAARAELDRLWAAGRDFLGCEAAILGGAMSWVSEHNLTAAISNAGGFGVLACGSMGPDLLEREIAATQALTQRPFGVNLITMHPQIDDLIRVTVAAGINHVVLAGGIPSGGAVRAVKDSGAKLVCFSPALVLAKRLVRSGADALVIEGSEAGGHIGPVSLTVLAQEILPHVRDVPVFVAGGLGRGEAYWPTWKWALPAPSRRPIRRRDRKHRPSALQAGLYPCLGARCGALGPARPALPGHPGARAGQ